MIEVRNLAYAYGRHQVLRDVSFTAGPGECVGILGNNGAGKSTLVTCLNKIRTPDAGAVLLDGRNVRHMTRQETARSIAYVAQKNEMSRTTVYDAVLLGRKPHMKWGLTDRDHQLCREMLARTGLADFKLRYVGELSGGEVQKVMLARALVQEPKLLILDEPTSNLDPKNQVGMLGLVAQMARERQITVLVVIHDLNLALRYCDRFLLLRDGLVYGCGDSSVITAEALRAVYRVDAQVVEVLGRKMVMIE